MDSVNETAEETRIRYVAQAARSERAEPVPGLDLSPGQASSPASVMVAVQAHSIFRGPMPSPEYLAQYDRIVPGAGRMIVEEFQMNGQHTRHMESMNARDSICKDARAQFIAGILVLIGFGLVYKLAQEEHDGVAIAVAVTLLVSVLTAFLTGTVMRDKHQAAFRAKPEDQAALLPQAAIGAASFESPASDAAGR
ncbi:hypothetical protein QCE63_27410 [Caballeronia sp. LZ065]|uniref:hypothetical protein n=1 Tax=Caballeronia sp. LZ065 TaxID=3038571 RepID=UPI0028611B26|nr:hypothetical protein [Caballeronia sp. LZ065]MDR5783141.1 hypothetical protein [Caballeronia sp. LZ065]